VSGAQRANQDGVRAQLDDGRAEEAGELRRMQIEADHTLRSRALDELRQQACRHGLARRLGVVGARVGEIGATPQ